jgi:hypothetical protein
MRGSRPRSDQRRNGIPKLTQKSFIRFLIPPPSIPPEEILAKERGKKGAPTDSKRDARSDASGGADGDTTIQDEIGNWETAFGEVAAQVSTAKAMLDADDVKGIIEEVLRAVDLYSGLKRQVSKDYNGQNVTNAWIKIYEIVSQMGLLIPSCDGTVRAFFNAELPGAFTVAVNHYVRTNCPSADYEWVASSFYPRVGVGSDPHNATILGDTYGLFECNRDRWIMDAPAESILASDSARSSATNNGDVTDVANVVDLVQRERKKFETGATLYTSDAGIDVSSDYARQEELTSLINFGQIVLGMLALDPGGDMVTKQYTFCQPFSATLLAIVAGFFKELYITKPVTSRPANSEVYVVGKGFLGMSPKAAQMLLAKIKYCKSHDVLPTSLGPLSRAPELAGSLEALLRAARQIHMRQQVEFLKEAVAFARKYKSDIGMLRRGLARLAIERQGAWLSDNSPFSAIKSSDHLRTRPCGRDASGGGKSAARESKRVRESQRMDDMKAPIVPKAKPCPTDFWIDPQYTDDEKAVIRKIVSESDPKPPLWYDPDSSVSPVKYRSDKGRIFRPSLHAGQRKLFIGELEYLAQTLTAWDQEAIVVYAGAAPGIHIPFLSRLFPNVTFHLYDPAKFGIKSSDRIRLYQEFFTDDTAKQWSGKCSMFISDIRLDPSDRKSIWSAEFEAQVGEDMKAQARWVEIIRPEINSMLKFRPPYGRGKFDYLEGKVMLQAWAPRTSTESRLIVPTGAADKSFAVRSYDHGDYEDFMYYLNSFLREWVFYPHSVSAAGLDHCYDCAHEIGAWRGYFSLKTGASFATSASFAKQIGAAIDDLTAHTPKPLIVEGNAHGRMPDIPMCLKRRQLYSQYRFTRDAGDDDE